MGANVIFAPETCQHQVGCLRLEADFVRIPPWPNPTR